MGAFVANFHVRTDQVAAVRGALAQLGVSQYRVAGPSGGWTTIHEERASTQDEDWIEQLATDLSAQLQTACVAFLVHDSDIARYWLCDDGQLVDEYNSVPDYFDQVSAAEKQRLRGKSDVFVRYCRPTVTRQQVETVLRTDVTFAEETIRQLAEFLNIDPDRSLEDFGDDHAGGGPGGLRIFDGGIDGDEDDDGDFDGSEPGGGGPGGTLHKLQQKLSGMFGLSGRSGTSPQGDALVAAAAAGDVAEIDRLVASGADVNAPGLLTIGADGAEKLATPIELPKLPAPPLVAAASRGNADAARRLVELGASVADLHPVFGSALHVAAQKGSAETVQVLLEAGVPADLKSLHGQTPVDMVRAMRNQLEMTKKMIQNMPGMEKMYDQLLARMGQLGVPEEGWNACEELLCEAVGSR